MTILISETNWHGNPRPVPSVSSVVWDEVNVDENGYAVFDHIVTSFSLGDLAPAASIVVPGPDLVVSGDVDGVWVNGAGLNVGITVTGGTNISTSLVNGLGRALGPAEFAAYVADALNQLGAGEVQCGATDNVVSISALGAVTGLTITTWAVA